MRKNSQGVPVYAFSSNTGIWVRIQAVSSLYPQDERCHVDVLQSHTWTMFLCSTILIYPPQTGILLACSAATTWRVSVQCWGLVQSRDYPWISRRRSSLDRRDQEPQGCYPSRLSEVLPVNHAPTHQNHVWGYRRIHTSVRTPVCAPSCKVRCYSKFVNAFALSLGLKSHGCAGARLSLLFYSCLESLLPMRTLRVREISLLELRRNFWR
jgi:hypothetical protein